MNDLSFFSEVLQPHNRAFLLGDAVMASFFVRESKLIMAEECYFFLMASMRKMRMQIPLGYTLEFFQQLLTENVVSPGIRDAVVTFVMYRNTTMMALEKAEVAFYAEVHPVGDILDIRGGVELDVIKEISVNTHLLSNIRVHSPENIYAEIYARENDLDEVILLNPNKRIARSISGNLMFLQQNIIKIPKQSEGAYISPLMENFVTFVQKHKLAEIQEVEMISFESQKADEILMVSDQKGIFAVTKIRNKSFARGRFTEMVAQWRNSFKENWQTQ